MKNFNEILNNFKMDKPKKRVFGNYRIEGNQLVYSTVGEEERTFLKGQAKELKEWAGEEEVKRVNYRHSYPVTMKDALSYIEDGIVKLSKRVPMNNEISRKVVSQGKTMLLGNTSILPLVGRTMAYGNEQLNTRETEIQRAMVLDGEFMMVPFTVFDQAKLNIDKFEMVERGPEQTLKINIPNPAKNYYGSKSDREPEFIESSRHFTGASLFRVDGQTYLFDVDRREVEHKIFNPFLATIKGDPSSIAEAYELLKPKAVVAAEKKGLKVLRQGEWFFIETAAPKVKKLNAEEKVLALSSAWGTDELCKILGIDKKKNEKKRTAIIEGIPKPGQLRAGNSRPNSVELLLKQGDKVFCKGKVSHTGREHADLNLTSWYLAVANTSIQNFTITGDID